MIGCVWGLVAHLCKGSSPKKSYNFCRDRSAGRADFQARLPALSPDNHAQLVDV